MVTFENSPGTLTRIMDRRHITIFKQRNSHRVQNWFKLLFLSAQKKKEVENYVHFYLKFALGKHASIVFKVISLER